MSLAHGDERSKRVLHVVGIATDEVFGFLAPATRALARSGHRQSILAIDDPRHRHNVRQLEELADVSKVARFTDPVAQWQAVFESCRGEILCNAPDALHVHGLRPCLVGALALRSAGVPTPLVFSPHGSRSLGTLSFLGKPAFLLIRALMRRSRSSAIVTVPREAQALDAWLSTQLVESPVHDAFFTVERREAPQPRIVSGGRESSARGLEVFTQLAVLLSGEELGLEFRWIGTVEKNRIPQFAAADVAVLPLDDELACARELSHGWIYVAPSPTRGFPLFLVQALAAGLPCVALDCAQHREVIEDSVTGFLCASEQAMVKTIATLVDDAGLRARIGEAARAAASLRFTETDFGEKLLSAYPPLTASLHPAAGEAR